MTKKLLWILLTACLVAAAGAALVVAQLERQFYVNRTPIDVSLGRITYLKNESWGTGPGGNETSVVVFKLRSAAIDTLRRDAWTFLETRPQETTGAGYRCRNYSNWRETPFQIEESDDRTGAVAGAPMTLGVYLNRYGFGIEVDTAVAEMIDTAFSAEGSFYGRSRCGMFLFMPELGHAAYIFVG